MSGAREEGPEPRAGQGGGRPEPEPSGGALSVDLPGLLAQLARSFALLLPVYALGYLGLSFSWVLLALGLLAWCRRSRGLKASRLCRALALLEDEERAVRLGVRACDLPAWVSAALPARRAPRRPARTPAWNPGRRPSLVGTLASALPDPVAVQLGPHHWGVVSYCGRPLLAIYLSCQPLTVHLLSPDRRGLPWACARACVGVPLAVSLPLQSGVLVADPTLTRGEVSASLSFIGSVSWQPSPAFLPRVVSEVRR